MAAVVPAVTIGKGHGVSLTGQTYAVVPPDGVVGVVGVVVVPPDGVVGVVVSGVVGVEVSGVVGVVVGVVVVIVAPCPRFEIKQNTAIIPPNKRTSFCDIFPSPSFLCLI